MKNKRLKEIADDIENLQKAIDVLKIEFIREFQSCKHYEMDVGASESDCKFHSNLNHEFKPGIHCPRCTKFERKI